MATKYWIGGVVAVAQVASATVDTYDAASTYTLTIGIGNKKVAFSTSGDGSVNATAAALQAAADASTHPYAAAITWTNSTNDIVATADVAGVPFTAALTVSGGTGTVTDFSDTTAMKSPHDFNDGDNWSDGSVPAGGDTAIFRDSAINVCWGLEDVSGAAILLEIDGTYTGRIGLASTAFATSSDGETIDSSAVEYRPTYLQLDLSNLTIGTHQGIGTPTGSGRIKIDNDRAGASTTEILETASASADSGLPAVRLKTANASADIYVRSASAGVGIAVDEPGETSTCGDVECSAENIQTQVIVGDGVTLTNFKQQGGQNQLAAAAAITLATIFGGELAIEGTQAITTLNVEGGTCTLNTSGTVTTCNVAGTLDMQRSRQARTITTMNLKAGGRFLGTDQVTITTLNEPSDVYAISVQ